MISGPWHSLTLNNWGTWRICGLTPNTYSGGTIITRGSGGAATNWHTGLIHVAAVPVPGFAGPNGLSLDAGGVVSLTFMALAGLRYRLLLKNDLHTTNAWAPVTPPLPDGWTNGANAPITLQDTTGTAVAQRFYRIETKSLSAP